LRRGGWDNTNSNGSAIALLRCAVRIEPLRDLVIRAEVVGRRGMSFAPLHLQCSFPSQTARDLLSAVVEQQLDEFRVRKQNAQLLRVLSVEAIEEGGRAGRIVSGAQDPDARIPSLPDAVHSALQAFEDGFFYMFVNGVQVDSLDFPIGDQQNIDLLFLRLTPLAGG
jgi:hypothetical protein